MQQGIISYPPAPACAIADNYHGTRIADPYRWLEQLESTKTRAWIEGQRTAIAAFFEQQPMCESVRRRLTELWRFPKYSVSFKHGTWRFFWGQDLVMQEDFQQQAVLYRQGTLEGNTVQIRRKGEEIQEKDPI